MINLVRPLLMIGVALFFVLSILCFLNALARNELLQIFPNSFVEPTAIYFDDKPNDIISIDYSFTVDNKQYGGSDRMHLELFNKAYKNRTIRVWYNSWFPRINHIENRNQTEIHLGFAAIFMLLTYFVRRQLLHFDLETNENKTL